jgi:DNA-binding beta-propeller fold protein YncE
MNHRLCLNAIAALSAIALSVPAMAADPIKPSGLHIVGRIPGPDGGWDYASFAPVRRRVYVTHGTQVMEIDADTGKTNPTFAAGDRLHAVVVVPGADVLVTTNSGDNSARIINAADGRLIASVPTAKDPDAAVYDPSSGLVLVMGGDSGAITVVDVKKAKALGDIVVGGALEFAAVDGKGRLFVNNEETAEVDVVDEAGRKVVARYPLAGCQRPTGLAYVEGDRLVSACANGVAKILDARTGRDIATPAIGARPDAVIYDPGRHIAMIPAAVSGTLTIISLSGDHDNTVVDTVPTQIGARTGAVDPTTGRVYLPTAEYSLPVPAGQRPTTKPGTFVILELGR